MFVVALEASHYGCRVAIIQLLCLKFGFNCDNA